MTTQATQTTVAEGQTAAAAPVLTKQEIKRNTLVNGPTGEAGERIAVVTKQGDLFVATYAGLTIASVKRAEDLASLLIDKKHTNTAQWANITELKFECEVPAGTPYKAGMTKGRGTKQAAVDAIVGEISDLNLEDADVVKKHTKDDLVKIVLGLKEKLAAL